MTDKRNQTENGPSNTEKDPSEWVTGDEPMTGAQRSYLKTLSQEAKVDLDEHLTKAEASQRIDELQQITGRGASGGHGARQDASEGNESSPEERSAQHGDGSRSAQKV